MQDFNDLLNGYTDGTKDLSINALTVAGTATLNGAINLGNASADDITVTGSLASSIPVKTDVTYNIGSSSLRIASVYGNAYYGTQTNDSAAAGMLGEMKGKISRAYSAAAPITTGSAGFVCTTTNIVLTAGDWTVSGDVGIEWTSGASVTDKQVWVTTNAGGTAPASDTLNLPTSGEVRFSLQTTSIAGTSADRFPIPAYRVSVANGATVTLYLVAQTTFTLGTAKTWGFLEARRMR